MTRTENVHLDSLLKIAEEDDSPITDWERQFLESLDGRRDRDMTDKQASIFDGLVDKHLKG